MLSRAEQDAKRYRDGYPGKGDDKRINDNLDFYSNKIRSRPHGVFRCKSLYLIQLGEYIDVIHKTWWGNYNLLEAVCVILMYRLM